MLDTLDTLLQFALIAIETVGLPVLFVIFVLKGALVGKIFPTSVFLPGYVVATGPSYVEAAVIVVLVTVAHIVGQLAIFLGSKRYGQSILAMLPVVDIDPESDHYTRVESWFDRFGGIAVFGTNVVPWTRGLIAIPAGMASYPTGRYTFHVGTSTLLYHAAYVAVPLAGIAIFA